MWLINEREWERAKIDGSRFFGTKWVVLADADETESIQLFADRVEPADPLNIKQKTDRNF